MDAADSTTSVMANTRYAGTRDTAKTSGRTRGHGGVAHDSAHVQKRKAGSPDNPKTRLSTAKIEATVQAARALFARDLVLKASSLEAS